ncbi:MAG TPA: hypothetical protein VJ827_04600 [Rubrobacter sp.]|nr:hypothetical protein [Rubrobacter sp.]
MSKGILEHLSEDVALDYGGRLLELEARGCAQDWHFVPGVSIAPRGACRAAHAVRQDQVGCYPDVHILSWRSQAGHGRYPIEALRPGRQALADPDYEQTLAM